MSLRAAVRRTLSGCALIAATAACATGARPSLIDSSPTSTEAPDTSTPTSVAPSSTTATTTTAPPRPVTLAFGGDVYGRPPVQDLLARGENPLAAVAPTLAAADVAVVNLETAVGSRGTPRDKQFVFQSDPSLLPALVEAGVDIVSVANNHSFDHGLEGFLETLDHVAASGLTATGGGHNAAEAYAPAIRQVGGVEVAVIGIAVIGPEEDDRAVGDRPGTTNGRDVKATTDAIAAARARTPIVVVVVHWGAELARCPRPAERALAQQMLDAGASVVVGAHPHVLQGVDARDGKLVAYSIGNFVFSARAESTRATGVLTVTIAPDGTVLDQTWLPARIDDAGRPVPLDGADADAARDAFFIRSIDGDTCD